jgi:hypothetical protein
MIGIVGSGFGLYGYLPAVINVTNGPVALMSRSMSKFMSRPEIAYCAPHIEWCFDENSFFEKVNQVIFCVSPEAQVRYINEWIDRANIESVLLEKPIAPNPAIGEKLITRIAQAGKAMHAGYIFQYTSWGQQLARIIQEDGEKISVELRWGFKAHHFKNNVSNWKREFDAGGSVLRFYGIQILAFLARLGFSTPIFSSTTLDGPDRFLWGARFRNAFGAQFRIELNCNTSTDFFLVKALDGDGKSDLLHFDLVDPFDHVANVGDKRIPLLEPLISDFLNAANNSEVIESFMKINDLWRDTEAVNVDSVVEKVGKSSK